MELPLATRSLPDPPRTISKFLVCVVDDDAAVRDGLSLMLESVGHEVRSFASAADFLVALPELSVGCLLLDMRMPGMTGAALQQELRRRACEAPIIFLTAHADVPTTVRAMQDGALNFLLKPVEPAVLLEGVRAAMGQAAARQRQQDDRQRLGERASALTIREREVMTLAVAGYSNKEIAQRLGISFRTVEIHRARAMNKTGAANLIELARIAEAASICCWPPPAEARDE